MKKLLVILCILLVIGGCTQNYQDLKPEKPVTGTILAIDSTQWTPVLIRHENETLFIYKDQTITKVIIVNVVATFFIGLVIGIVISLFVAIVAKLN